jgi:hypothetical protein
MKRQQFMYTIFLDKSCNKKYYPYRTAGKQI